MLNKGDLMKITKLGHSCVLVETEDRVGLFDPGVWSDRELIDRIEHVDRIVYTHEHPDHFDVEILKSLVDRFPQAHVVCNDSIREKIEDAAVEVTIREETQCTRKFKSPHERLPIPGVEAPPENGYHFKEVFTSPGDSHSFTETKKVLAMPFIAPWGKTGDAINKVIELKPEYVLPIHDWHYTEEAREWLQGIINTSLKPHGIKVLSAISGETQEIHENFPY